MSDYREYDIHTKPISPWGYIGYEILFAIPVIGFLAAIGLALGSTNVNVKNYARSKFCIILLVIIIIVGLGVLGIFPQIMELLESFTEK